MTGPSEKQAPPDHAPHLSQVLHPPLGLGVRLGLPQLQQTLHLSLLELLVTPPLFLLLLVLPGSVWRTPR